MAIKNGNSRVLDKAKAVARHPLTFYAALIALLYFFGFFNFVFGGGLIFNLEMPGQSYAGALEPLTAQEEQIKKRLQDDIAELTVAIGKRNISHYQNLQKSAEYIARRFRDLGYEVKFQDYSVSGVTVRNIEAEITGQKLQQEIMVIGAHYDSADTVAANDNGSGVAAMLSLAGLLKDTKPERTIRFVAFVNEEPPYFQTSDMGSLVYAKRAREKNENIIGAFSLETMGYYSDQPQSQHYPFPLNRFYPDTGNFIGFVGDGKSTDLVRKTIGLFRQNTKFPSEGAAISSTIPGVGWSDHWSFWQHGYRGLMITDTAPYRYPFYHEEEDTIDKIDFDRLSRVVMGLAKTFSAMAGKS
ncbi:MAG: peptidase [Alphaproteobacteria bacterium]|nr:peptidase [Alphaproteobacteria bacterium]